MAIWKWGSSWTHVHSRFCQNAGSGDAPNARHGTGQLDLLLVGLKSLCNFRIQFGNHPFDIFHVMERLLDEQTVMVGHSMTFQRFHDLRNFWPQSALRQLRDLCRRQRVLQ